MVVDDLQDLRLVDPLHRLALFVVVHQDQLLFMQVHHVSAGDYADVVPVVIQHREVAESDGGHHLGGGLHGAVQIEGEQIVPHHVVADGGGLADHLSGDIGAVRGADDHTPLLLSQHADGPGHLAACAHHHAARPHLDGGELALTAVGHDDDVPFGDGPLHLFRASRADDDAPLHLLAGDVSHQHLGVQDVHDVLIAGL